MLVENAQRLIGLLSLLTLSASIGAMAYAGSRYRRRRSDAMSSAGMALGFLASTDDPVKLPEMHLLAHKGLLDGYTNVLRGISAGFETIIFDFVYRRLGEIQGVIVKQTVVAFYLSGANMPDFQLRPRTFADKVRSLLSSNHLTFESHPEFAKRYIATGADLVSAEVLFTPAVLSFFEGHEIGLLNVEGYSDWIIVYQPGNLAKPSNLGTFIDAATQIAAGLVGQVPRSLFSRTERER